MRALKTSYKGVPNQYRFTRQIKSDVFDLWSFCINPPGPTNNSIARYVHPAFQMNQLEQFTQEFGPLFSNYIVDRITMKFIPMWAQTTKVVDATVPTATLPAPAMCVTRIQTRWSTHQPSHPIIALTTDDEIRSYLAQLQMQSNTMYGSRKALTLTTRKPRLISTVSQLGVQPGLYPGQVSNTSVRGRWLDIDQSSDVDWECNHIFLAQLVSQGPIQRGLYLYRVITKVDFRCSLVH